jgi:hypothetical protein
MDLRIVKTKKNINESFLQLRSKNALEKIRVTELCDLAIINKTTFYKHYQDIYALSEEIENETLASIFNDFEDLGELFSSPQYFIKGLINAFHSHEKIILILFSDRMNVLVEKVEKQLKAFYLSKNNTPEEDIIISFLIGGATHVLLKPKYDEIIVINTLSNILSSIK